MINLPDPVTSGTVGQDVQEGARPRLRQVGEKDEKGGRVWERL